MRVIARLDCQFSHNGTTHEGVIVDISLKGAFISSRFLPPANSEVSITLQTPHLPEMLILKAGVLRANWGMSDYGKVGRFGVQFSDPPLVLFKLINQLSSPQHRF